MPGDHEADGQKLRWNRKLVRIFGGHLYVLVEAEYIDKGNFG